MNNNREWFDENRNWYKDVKVEVEAFVDNLIADLQKMDPSLEDVSAKNTVFRLFRDIRFSNDKTPYKNHFGAYIASGGRKSLKAGYYIHIEPDNSFLGGGIYMPPAPQLLQIRTAIYDNIDEYNSIINNPVFKQVFGKVDGEELKTSPKGFPKDFAHLELIKLKSYTVWRKLSDEEILSPSLKADALKYFEVMKPLNQFFNKAV